MSSASPADNRVPGLTALPGQHHVFPSLPVPLTSLVGRDAVLEHVGKLLDDPSIRLLTLTGPGGIGKTRLAMETAARLRSEYAHGACFVPLAPVQDAGQVIPAVAQALGIRESADVSLTDVVTSVLRDQHTLLVLDNFEHVIEGAVPWLGELLGACPRLTVLVTSRAALRVGGERRYSVPPLPLPEDGTLHSLSENAAVRLFVERAQAVQHDFALTESNSDDVRDICRQLDGIPLAIELAAARVNVMSPREIASHLPDRFDLLICGDRDLPVRHQTMRNAIGWSYDLLSEPERTLFRGLSVFVGGFTLDAAEAVADPRTKGCDKTHVVDVLGSLVDHSLVRHGTDGRGDPRFWMLETIRQFGSERLSAHGEETMACDAHAAWYLRLGVDADQGLYSSDEVMWLDRLDAERDNLHLVFAWLLDQDRVEDAATLAFGLLQFLYLRGHRHAFRPYTEALLEHPRLAAPSVARGMALMVEEAYAGGPVSEQSVDALREASTFYREHGDHRLAGFALKFLGGTYMARDDFERATTALEEAVALARDVGEAFLVSVGLCNLGICAWKQGSTDDATARWEEGGQVACANGLSWLLAVNIGNLGYMALNRGDHDRAEALFLEAMELRTAVGDRRDLPVGYAGLADIARVRGDYATAQGYLEEAVTVAQDLGDVQLVAYSSMALGTIASLRGMPADAVAWLRRSVLALAELGRQADMTRCIDAFAAVAVSSGDLVVAARLIGAADAVLERLGIPRTEGRQRQEHQACVAAARAALDEAAFVAAYDAGQALTLDQAVAEALAFVPSGQSPRSAQATNSPSAAHGLSQRELEVLRLMADGLTNQEIADALFLSPRTAANHAANILGKLGVNSRTGVVAYAIRNGLA